MFYINLEQISFLELPDNGSKNLAVLLKITNQSVDLNIIKISNETIIFSKILLQKKNAQLTLFHGIIHSCRLA
jgi:hypothetical protein